MRKTLKKFLAQYGMVAVVVYLTIFSIVLFAAWGLIALGLDPTGMAQNVGAFTAAYIATKIARPVRIAATLAFTPLLVRGWERVRGVAAGGSSAP